MAKLGASSPERDQEMDARYREAFQSEAGRKKRKKGIKAFFCITLVLSVLVSLLNWGIITGWGNVKVERLTLSGYNGDRISALLYIPKNATSETPAPLVFNCHGNAGNGRNHESWAVEFARRGFVVLSVDLYGSGDSENSAESFASMAMLTSVTDTFYEHMLNRDYVDKDNILIGAHSMGGSVAAGLAGQVLAFLYVLAACILAASVKNTGIWDAVDWSTVVLALLLGVLMCVATVLRGPLFEDQEGEDLDEFSE